MCARLKAGIHDAIHGIRALWDKKSTTEGWGFLLIDANNAFNEIYRFRMLWTVRHLWPSRARVVFNCYCHWSLLVLRNGNGMDCFMHSKEGVTQGDPLAMIA